MSIRGSKSFKEISTMFEKLCNHQSPYKVWSDMMVIYSSMISNTIDLAPYRKEREQLYLTTIKSYRPEEVEMLEKVFALIVDALEEDPFQDCLGTIYMELGIGNKNTGQFFTPYHLSRLMAQTAITKEIVEHELKAKGYITFNEPTCGAGANLIAACSVLHEMGINYQTKAFFVAQDIDSTVARMCYIQLSLLGCAGYVRIGDTLRNPITANVLMGEQNSSTWYTPMWFSSDWVTVRLMDAVRRFREYG